MGMQFGADGPHVEDPEDGSRKQQTKAAN